MDLKEFFSASAKGPAGRRRWFAGCGPIKEYVRRLNGLDLKRQGVDLKIGQWVQPIRLILRQSHKKNYKVGMLRALLKWVGPRKDIAAILAEAAIAVLPSYREGLPKALLEAASCGTSLLQQMRAGVPGDLP